MMKKSSRLSKRNQRGMWVMVVVLFFIIITPRLLKAFRADEPWTISSVQLSEEMNQMESEIKEWKKQEKNFSKSKYSKPSTKFNPNNYSREDWMKLGLSEKQANVVLKFSKRGIDSNDELKQIFVIPDELFALIKDSTIYPELKDQGLSKQENWNKNNASVVIIELNNSTKEQLVQLNGIGNFYAEKIVEYRESLGGYHSKEQLLEIWKFDNEKLSSLESQISIDASAIRKLNINTATVEELKAHPYISWNIANSIVKMRAKHQKYSNFEQLLESVLIDKTVLDKLKPYLSL